MKYAKVIIDISSAAVDRPFTYEIPPELEAEIVPGVRVTVPFGNSSQRTGYCIETSNETDVDLSILKPVTGIVKNSLSADDVLIRLALFMADEYGCTMNQAMQTVLPVKRKVGKNRRRTDPVERMERLGTVRKADETLNPAQEKAVQEILSSQKPTLLHGITGSGKTRVYIELIRRMMEAGKQTIVLIPEISLTYQTVTELTAHLGEQVAVMHSRLTAGEKFEQFEKAANGTISVMVGPRSAVFAPFEDLGLIIIDEEHEGAYRSDISPRYDAREVARLRADLCGAKLLLGSATPSLESYTMAKEGTYELSVLKERAVPGAGLPGIRVADMRKELAEGNKSAFSRMLYEGIADRLEKKEQVMLFLNRRGYAGFVSCRSCGFVIKCPHCDVSMTAHNDWYTDPRTGVRKAALLSCHYCGHTAPMPEVCPQCGSRFLAPFGTGTQKLEQMTKRIFPSSRVLRMDADTTARKDAHEKILSSFRKGEADILIGTQMIVKGHDFPGVTLVGIVAADQSINVPDYTAAERTFQLLTQAAGRSGRAGKTGEVIIQSYEPEHYAIQMAASGDYESFYQREMSFRSIMRYPPDSALMTFRLSSEDAALLDRAASDAAFLAKDLGKRQGVLVIGPGTDGIGKINDVYRKAIFLRHGERSVLKDIRDRMTDMLQQKYGNRLMTGSDIR